MLCDILYIIFKMVANEDTMLRTHCCGHKICVRDTKMFLISFRNILRPQQMFPGLRSIETIMSNNVSSFATTFTFIQRAQRHLSLAMVQCPPLIRRKLDVCKAGKSFLLPAVVGSSCKFFYCRFLSFHAKSSLSKLSIITAGVF